MKLLRKKYILVICDYATCYPEAIPLRSIEAESITEEEVKLFARIGVPQEILTDQGSNFTSIDYYMSSLSGQPHTIHKPMA